MAPVRASDWAFFDPGLAVNTADIVNFGQASCHINLELIRDSMTQPVASHTGGSLLETSENALERSVRELVTGLIDRDDWFIVDIRVRGAKGARVVEIYLDGDEGITVDDMAKISRGLAFEMDAEDLIKGKYHLNVSSPGDDRALVLPRQFARHEGKTLQVLVNREESQTWVEGENLGIQDGVLTLRSKKSTERIAWDDLQKAKIKLPW